MRLTSLKPRWIGLSQWASEDPFYVGVSFLCPHCIHEPCPTCGHQRGERLAVKFWPPIDPKGLMGRMFEIPDNGGHRRTAGDTFESLTLTPSIGFDTPPHFHGSITNGEVVNQIAPMPR